MLENVFKDREEEGFKRAEVSGLLTIVLSDDVGMSNNAPDWVRCGPSFIAIQWQCSV
jgi:hypothetical protein